MYVYSYIKIYRFIYMYIYMYTYIRYSFLNDKVIELKNNSLPLLTIFGGVLWFVLFIVSLSLTFWQPIPESTLPPRPCLSQRGQLNPFEQWQLPALLHVCKKIALLRSKYQLLLTNCYFSESYSFYFEWTFT